MPNAPNELIDVIDQLKAAKIVKDAVAAVDKAQLRAMFDTSAARAFFTQLAIKLEVKPDWSIPTANVDGKTIRYNPGFIAGLYPDGVHFVIVGHEPAHCTLQHLVRGMGMECDECRQKAADLEVNALCREAGFAILPDALLPGVGKFRDYKPGDSFEQYYAKMHAEHKQQQGQGKQPDGQPQPGDGDSDPGKCGSFSPAKDDAEAQQIESEWRGKIAAAAQEVGRKMAEGKLKGDLPGDMQRWIDNVLHPKPHWRETLRDFTTQSLRKKNDNDWSRRSRRGIAAGIYLPQHKGEELGHIIVHVDCSGSCWDMIPEFSNELHGILACEPAKVTILYWDTKLKGEPVEWSPDSGEEFKVEQRGGGGTDHRGMARWIHEYQGDDELVAVIALTDGQTTFPDDYGIPTLWVITPDGDTDVPFGRVVKMTA